MGVVAPDGIFYACGLGEAVPHGRIGIDRSQATALASLSCESAQVFVLFLCIGQIPSCFPFPVSISIPSPGCSSFLFS